MATGGAAQTRLVRELGECGISELETMRRTAVRQAAQRVRADLLSNKGNCIAKIAQVFDNLSGFGITVHGARSAAGTVLLP